MTAGSLKWAIFKAYAVTASGFCRTIGCHDRTGRACEPMNRGSFRCIPCILPFSTYDRPAPHLSSISSTRYLLPIPPPTRLTVSAWPIDDRPIPREPLNPYPYPKQLIKRRSTQSYQALLGGGLLNPSRPE